MSQRTDDLYLVDLLDSADAIARCLMPRLRPIFI